MSTRIEQRISASMDDVEEEESGNIYANSSDLELVYDGEYQVIGLRFALNLPQGVRVDEAKLQFTVDEVSTEPTSLGIYLENSLDAQPFSNLSHNVSSRTFFRQSVPWLPADWTSVGEAGTAQQTPDISALIQAAVDQPDWKSGSHVVVVIKGSGRRTASSYDGEMNKAPLLSVLYTNSETAPVPEEPVIEEPVVSKQFTSRISSSLDDVEEEEDGNIYADSSDIELIYDGEYQVVGLRFAVDLPQGARIDDANLQFTVDKVSRGDSSLQIGVEQTHNAAPFQKSSYNVSSRTLFAKSVAWSPSVWRKRGRAGARQRTPDISALIQAAIDQPDWQAGNHLAVVIKGSGRRVASSFDGKADKAPLLVVNYQASEGGGTTDPQPSNHAPTISGLPASVVAENTPYSFAPAADDADGDKLNFSVRNLPAWAGFDPATGIISGTPGFDSAGNYDLISISVTDGAESATLADFSIAVSDTNRGPAISGSPTGTVDEGSVYSFSPNASDADGDVLVFSISNKPAWASFNTTTGQLYGTPGTGTAGSYGNISISVTDSADSALLDSFTITVIASEKNQAPTIVGSPLPSVAEGSAYTFSPSASDADGDTLSFSITSKPDWASFNTTTGRLNGTPGYDDAGSYGNILISVTDGTENTSLPSFTITVSNTNRAPTINGVPAENIDEGSAYSFTPIASDADGDDLSFSIANKPTWASFNTATGQLSGAPGVGTAGNYENIRISVSDSTESSTLNAFQILVNTAAQAGGDNLYVDLLIGPSSCNDYHPASRACGAGSDTAFRNLSGAAAAAVAGETVLIREGDYNEPLIPQRSGSPGNYITYRNYDLELATITGTDLTPGIDISDRQYLILQGLRVHNVRRWMYALNAHHNILQHNSFLRALDTSGSAKTGLFFQEATHNKILNNTIGDSNEDNLALVKSDHNLVEGNTFVRANHVLWTIKCGSFNVIRNNYLYNEIQKIGEIYDCDNVGFDHEFTIHDATKHNLVEGNTFAKTSYYYSTSGGNGIQYAGQNGIIRQNVFYENNTGLSMQHYTPEALYVTHNRAYNNVFHKNKCGGIGTIDTSYGNYEDNIFVNNILSWNSECDEPNTPYQHVFRNSMSGYKFDTNNLFSGNPGDDVIGRWGGSGITLAAAQNNNPDFYANNIEQDPQFVDEAGRDFTLEPTSPMIDAGRFLTITVGSGSGTTLVVDDAGYFYDGFGIAGEAGDEIQLQGSSETARIVEINYANHTITLDRALSWNASQGVALKYNGAAPDMGAFEHVGTTDPLLPNHAPTITGEPVLVVAENTPYNFAPAGADADGDKLIFSVRNLPAWASFNSATGVISGTPGFDGAGSYSDISVSVTDGKASAALSPFSLVVSNVNRAPVIGGEPAAEVSAGKAYSFIPSASDADGDSMTFTVTGKPTWLNFDRATGTLSGTPAESDVGEYMDVAISVSDGTITSRLAPFSIQVTGLNHLPVAVDDIAAVVAGESVMVAVLANDTGLQDGPISLRILQSATRGELSVTADNKVVYLAAAGYSGRDSFAYQVVDLDGDSATATVNVDITCITSCETISNRVQISWTPSEGVSVQSYRVYYGQEPGNYQQWEVADSMISHVVTLPSDGAWYLAVTAIDNVGIESAYSEEIIVRF
ncbi:MAG: cadherin-like domain-containing protein [Gammaproteobacteria bacterium (ex Lamellibrachia satsuma)]|nr:MAG: cadherin-like domain-containing protein [Gammaproteobacteria bacterium (ex Lamellibrachia satsuma)]